MYYSTFLIKLKICIYNIVFHDIILLINECDLDVIIVKFKGDYFKSMYSFGPIDYDLKFMHYYIDMKESYKEDAKLIDEDLLNLKD